MGQQSSVVEVGLFIVRVVRWLPLPLPHVVVPRVIIRTAIVIRPPVTGVAAV